MNRKWSEIEQKSSKLLTIHSHQHGHQLRRVGAVQHGQTMSDEQRCSWFVWCTVKWDDSGVAKPNEGQVDAQYDQQTSGGHDLKSNRGDKRERIKQTDLNQYRT